MRALNPRYLADGRIDAEIEHPELGWIPYTADPNSDDPDAKEIWKELKSRSDIEPYRPEPQAKKRNDTDSVLVTRGEFRRALRQLGMTDAQVDALFGL